MQIPQIEIPKKLIFTVTPGRSGTTYLTKLLAAIPDVTSLHEPAPNFYYALRLTQEHPMAAYNFLYQYKIPAIRECPTGVYAESSHLTCKGFIEPMIRMGLRPHLIILRRPAREVAWSFLGKKNIPGRIGGDYVLNPGDPNVVPLPGWEDMTDYQLCFWYALEIERRQYLYSQWAADLNMVAFDVTNKELNDWETYACMLTALGLPTTKQVHQSHIDISGEIHNRIAERQEIPDGLDEQEEQVWDAVSLYQPLLRDLMNSRYAPAGTAA